LSPFATFRLFALAARGGALVELATAGFGEDPGLLDLLIEAAKRSLERLAITGCWSPRLLFKGNRPPEAGPCE